MTGKAKHFALEVKDDIHEFFHEMKQFATPTATRVVREETGTGLRDGEENNVELPTFWSKRSVYGRFCFERGYVITSTHRGNVLRKERTDELWNQDDKK